MKSRQKRTTSPAIGAGPGQHPAEHDRTERVQLEVERGDDAEVAAATAQTPEQVGVLVGRRRPPRPSAVTTSASIRLSHVKPNLRSSQPLPLPERETGDPGVGHPAAGDREAVLLGRGVELAPVETGLGAHGPRPPGRPDALHAAHVDHSPPSTTAAPVTPCPPP